MSSQKNIFEIGPFLSEHGPFFEKCILARSVRRVPNRPKIEKIDFHQTHPKWPKFREKVENRKISARKVHFGPISADLDPEKKVPKNAFFWKSENPVFATPTARKPKIRFSRFWAHFVEFSEHFKMNLMTPQSDPPFSHTGPEKTAKIAKILFDGAGIVEKIEIFEKSKKCRKSTFGGQKSTFLTEKSRFWPIFGFSKFFIFGHFWPKIDFFDPKSAKNRKKIEIFFQNFQKIFGPQTQFLPQNAKNGRKNA